MKAKIIAWLSLMLVLPLAVAAQGIPEDHKGPPESVKPLPLPLPIVNSGITTSLQLQACNFTVLETLGAPDGQFNGVTVVGIRSDAEPTNSLPFTFPGNLDITSVGFNATFTLDNNTGVDRTFDFAADYYASQIVGVRVLDSGNNVVWQSYEMLTNLPTVQPAVQLTLAKLSAWKEQVYVPVYLRGQTIIAPGDYTLEAELLGSPAFSARASFSVGAPVIVPVTPTPAVRVK